MIISEETLAQLLSARLGGSVTELTPIPRGMAHRMLTGCWQQGEHMMPIVVRFFHGPRALDEARAEAEALRELSRECYPVPDLYLLAENTAAPFIVMQQLAGETLTQIALARPETIPAWLDKASDLLLRLHGLNWQDGYELLKPVLTPLDFADRQVRWWEKQARALNATDLAPGFDWLRANLYHTRESAPQTLVHRDFHPDNMLADDQTQHISGVVDWGELTVADPAVDVAWTRMILTTEANEPLGNLFTDAYTRRNPQIRRTLPFWEVFSACKRLVTITAIKANQSERLSMWAGSPDLKRLAGREEIVQHFMAQRLTREEME